ncbi:hypothetical protein KL918_000454 [Ogataea parapolymorpha]|uniref:Pre-mRNA-splicing factor CWC22 n=1 Tax=Ogataea parapolymorpha (strain ATCC 26012 / BCRC 20466 / JCM 22074 / NRRL Y-7560 / DL-1) TaxID=871575 RepID=W1QAV6_OGAPD|nr:Pre-mRNA-splicing factor CWC22 [Ogataea parapolymorpha DL-1]ESW96500.1 Pre-mRNA-splicing factor CWC22 [Ogataea parapolymorpha DL-1]KAG7870250.1 hypothetical protein KL918_000454 [Ogataea parapolymorpha]KAG7875199.1 hypothetical protein KL916_000811 [Ogataea parapolymorpha]
MTSIREVLDSKKYVPPAKLKALLEESDVSYASEEYQRLQWEKLKKQINGEINKVNTENIKEVVLDLFKLNLIRGKGWLVRCLMKSQVLSQAYTTVYAALICVLNSKIPELGELLVTRLILQFRKAYKNDDRETSKASVIFLSQLVNYQVCHDIVALQLLFLLLEHPTDTTVEIACALLQNCGQFLSENSSVALNAVFERLGTILTEDLVSKRIQLLIQEAFKQRKNNYDGAPVIVEELDLVEDEDKVTHTLNLDDKLKAREILNTFQFDQEYEKHEQAYDELRKQILGFEDDSSYDEGDEESEDDEADDVAKEQIRDLTESALTNFQKTVYLTMMSSINHEEAVHKLLKLQPVDPERKEQMLVDMIVKCCAQEKTYSKYYALVGEKLISVNRNWTKAFDHVFVDNYTNCHQYELSLIRNIGSFWGHMFASDKMGWEILQIVQLTEESTNSASRIFLKFLFVKLQEELGLKKLKVRLSEEYIQPYISGLFPSSGADRLRFSINYFTAIGLGALTEDMREILNNLPENEESGVEDENERKRNASPDD